MPVRKSMFNRLFKKMHWFCLWLINISDILYYNLKTADLFSAISYSNRARQRYVSKSLNMFPELWYKMLIKSIFFTQRNICLKAIFNISSQFNILQKWCSLVNIMKQFYRSLYVAFPVLSSQCRVYIVINKVWVLPSGRGFGFSRPPSCISSKEKETLCTCRDTRKHHTHNQSS